MHSTLQSLVHHIVTTYPHASQLLSGSVSGSMAKTIVYPLERFKMLRQVPVIQNTPFNLPFGLNDFYKLIKKEGYFSLWKGNGAALCRTFPHSGIVFFCFDLYYDFFSPFFPSSLVFLRFFAGSLSGLTSTLVTYPLDVWNTRMAVSKGCFRYYQVALFFYEGHKSLTRGLLPTLIGMLPYAGVSFTVFSTLKEYFLSNSLSNPHHLTTLQSLLCGGIAGLSSQTVVYPLDTIRKTMQANTFLSYYNVNPFLNSSFFHSILLFIQHSSVPFPKNASFKNIVMFIYQNKGLQGFYNGLFVNWIKGFLATGLSFAFHEKIQLTLSRLHIE
ncbi:mitochondrial coenzyme A transporter SLC25A42-like isoform X2 [Hylaeus volcanicus]|uniref:mitochondrial coenzyme A transporter SLC25A42-like isoform X2 n=1 Tax=Hylaeus volcanicus TaxID=313075 RepID=UPI0023B7D5E9|nr:mitochondrial coenzyme A transporter SLC25A42-like isoform X2 [Hylaeus volcanicus]